MTEVFDLVYHGGGGFSYTEVWEMDIPKRRFNIKKINEHLERQRQMQEDENNVLTDKSDNSKMIIPEFAKPKAEEKPTFVSKVKPKA
jgi:isopentenyl phosphate kinase